MTLSTGQVLNNRYRVDGLVGKGGFGAVYRAMDTVLNRVCALKESLDTSSEALLQFQQEAVVLASLDHSCLPRVTDHFVLPDLGHYLVMDFVEGLSLAAMIKARGGPLKEAEVLPWIEQVCDALTYLHTQIRPIIHRDIKPQNIIITPAGRATLVDFGISKVSDPKIETLAGGRAATEGFSPPEQYGSGRTDPRSDIYALGATLYAALTGQVPPDSVARLTGSEPLQPPRELQPGISTRTEAAILKALEPQPTQRFQTAAQMWEALTGTSQVSPTLAVGETLLAPTRAAGRTTAVPPVPRWLPAAGAAAAVLVVAAILLGGGILRNRRSSPEATATAVQALALSAGTLGPGSFVDGTVRPQPATDADPAPSGPAISAPATGTPEGRAPLAGTSAPPQGAHLTPANPSAALAPAGQLLASPTPPSQVALDSTSAVPASAAATPASLTPGSRISANRAAAAATSPARTPAALPLEPTAPIAPSPTWEPGAGVPLSSRPTGVTRAATRSPPSPTTTQTAAPLVDPAEEGRPLLLELFASNQAGWDVSSGSGQFGAWTDEIVNGRLRLTLKAKDDDVVSDVMVPRLKAGDFLLLADATVVAAPAGCGQRIYFRCSDEKGSSCYVAEFSSTGEYALGRIENGDYTAIREFTRSDAIRTAAGASNTFGVRAAGSTFTLYANGRPLGAWRDTTLPAAGFLDLGVRLDHKGDSATVEFDNVFISEPSGSGNPSIAVETGGASKIVIFDRFDNNALGWNVGDTAGQYADSTYQVEGGVLSGSISAKDSVITTMHIPNVAAADSGFWVDAKWTDYTDEGQVALVFRCLDDSLDNCYRARFSTDGSYAIAQWHDGTDTTLQPWTSSKQIRTGVGASNNFGVVAKGKEIQVFANGQLLQTLSNAGVTGSGTYRIGVGAFGAGTEVDVEFDNLLIADLSDGP